MKALDRGDENDKQVWGSEHGPYQFERISNGDARNQSSINRRKHVWDGQSLARGSMRPIHSRLRAVNPMMARLNL